MVSNRRKILFHEEPDSSGGLGAPGTSVESTGRDIQGLMGNFTTSNPQGVTDPDIKTLLVIALVYPRSACKEQQSNLISK